MKTQSNLTSSKVENIKKDFEKRFTILKNRYLLILFTVLLFYAFFSIAYFGDFAITIPLVAFMFIIAITFFFNKKWDSITFVMLIFLMLIILVSFFYNYTYKQAGIECFYFSILFATPFFFDIKKDLVYILIIAGLVSIFFIGFLIFDFSFLPKSTYIKTSTDLIIIKALSVLTSLITFFIDIVFMVEKDKSFYKIVVDNENHISTIEELTIANNELLQQQIIINNLSEDNITEICELAEENSPLFLETFKVFFPDFIPNILKINSELINSDLHFCALIKLNFDTKKIAKATNISVRAVESKKYRIRKKLKISTDTNINSFILRV